MKLGRFDYLQKPFRDRRAPGRRPPALEHQRLRTEYRYLLNDATSSSGTRHHRAQPGEGGGHPAGRAGRRNKSTFSSRARPAPARSLLHARFTTGARSGACRLIKVNCAAFPKRCWVGAVRTRPRRVYGRHVVEEGKFALADGGSIFLDEIGTMSLDAPVQAPAACCRSVSSNRLAPSGRSASTWASCGHQTATCADGRQASSRRISLRLNVIPTRDSAAGNAGTTSRARRTFRRKHAQRTGPPGWKRNRDGVLVGLQQYDWPARARARKHHRARCRAVARHGYHERAISACWRLAAGRRAPALSEAPAEHRWVERETIRRALETSGGVKKDAGRS